MMRERGENPLPPGGHRWRGRGCSRRMVRFMEPVLLLLLHHGPAHGYTLLEQLAPFGVAACDPSVVYRALREMEDQSLVVSAWDELQTQGPPRRVYRLTAAGDEVLAFYIRDLEETRAQIDGLLQSYRRHMAEGAGEHHQETEKV
jgi:PadR family transcriptional regulator PadR